MPEDRALVLVMGECAAEINQITLTPADSENNGNKT